MENSPINAFQQLMAITAEECGELTQVAMKQIRKYDDVNQMDENMHRQLIEEVGDVMCMFDLMIEYGIISKDDIDARIQIKRDKLKSMEYINTSMINALTRLIEYCIITETSNILGYQENNDET